MAMSDFGKSPKQVAGCSTRNFVYLLLLFLASVFSVGTAVADDMEVDVELILAVDVSRSMTPNELEIQRRGYAEAIVSDEVIGAIRDGLIGRIAITYVEWAGSWSQNVVVDWMIISNVDEARVFAEQLTARFENSLRRTSISGAIDFTSGLFEDNGYIANRQVIDISGDGPNNHGRPVVPARDEALARGIVINGLPLMTKEGMGTQWMLDDLDQYYRHCVIGGPRSFVLPVREWSQFPAAVRQKLVLELAGNTPTLARDLVVRIQASEAYDCLVGEKIWNRMRDIWSEP